MRTWIDMIFCHLVNDFAEWRKKHESVPQICTVYVSTIYIDLQYLIIYDSMIYIIDRTICVYYVQYQYKMCTFVLSIDSLSFAIFTMSISISSISVSRIQVNPRNMMPEMPQTPAASQSMDLKKDRGWAVMRWSWNCLLKRRNKGQPVYQWWISTCLGGNFVWPVYNEKASSHWVWIDRPKHHQGEVSSIPKTGEVGNWVYPSPQQLFGGISFQDIWITLGADIKIKTPS